MEISRYALLEVGSSPPVIVSGLYGSIIRVSEEVLEHLTDLRSMEKNKREIFDILVKNKIIVDPEEELEFFRRAVEALKRRKELDLLVNPTRRCNMRCIYCYEPKLDLDMSEEVVRGIPRLIRRITEERDVEKLLIGFFGGEPLLRRDLMEKILDEISVFEEELDIGTGLITNGTLLTRDVVELLSRYEVSMVQVTLDGPRTVHNSRRPLIGNRGSYDLIMSNLEKSVDVIPLLQVRVNVDKSNVSKVIPLLDDLEERGLKKDNVRIYFARVYAATSTNESYRSECLYEDYELVLDLVKEARERGFKVFYRDYPQPRYLYCAAFTGSHFIIDANGDVYTCLGGVGHDEYVVGSVLREKLLGEKLVEWTSRSPMVLEPCSSCVFSPICGGGCGSEAIGYNGGLFHPACPPSRHIWKRRFIPLREYLIRWYHGEKYRGRGGREAPLNTIQ